MDNYIAQARHNLDFLKILEEKEADRFYDWKITISFYIAIHWMKALIKEKQSKDVFSHLEIENCISHKRTNHTSPVSKSCFELYSFLYQASRTSRYNGFVDIETFNAYNKAEYLRTKGWLEKLQLYFSETQKLKI